MDSLKSFITNEKTKGAIAIAAAVVMWFTPDHIDALVEAGLTAIGITKLIIKEKE